MKPYDQGYEGHPPDLTVTELIVLLFFRNGRSVAAIARLFRVKRQRIEEALREHYSSLRQAYNSEIAKPLHPPSTALSIEPGAFDVDF
jgi:hypothetical protein